MTTGGRSDSSSYLEKILRRRRMTRRFDGGPDLDDVAHVLEASLRAPSAGFSQGVHLVVLSGAKLEEFWDRTGAREWFTRRSPGVVDATYVVLVLGDRQEYLDRYGLDDKRDLGLSSADRWHTPYWMVDAAMVAENLLLLAEERRWGALFFGLYGDQQRYFDELGIPHSAHCIGAVAVGFRAGADEPTGSPTSRTRRDPKELVHFGRWEQ